MTKYSKDYTIKELNEELSFKGLYKAKCINWKGKPTDSDEQYSEIIAKKLIEENIREKLDKIPSISRKESYFQQNHCNGNINKSNRAEENFAKRITGMELGHLGLIIDYQIPLKNIQKNEGIGKIDLISYNKNDKILFLIELKYPVNKETLLRALLEIYTYYRIVDKNKLIEDFKDFLDLVNPDKIKIIPSVLIVPGCNAYKELKEMEDGKRPYLKALSQSLGITIEEIKDK